MGVMRFTVPKDTTSITFISIPVTVLRGLPVITYYFFCFALDI